MNARAVSVASHPDKNKTTHNSNTTFRFFGSPDDMYRNTSVNYYLGSFLKYLSRLCKAKIWGCFETGFTSVSLNQPWPPLPSHTDVSRESTCSLTVTAVSKFQRRLEDSDLVALFFSFFFWGWSVGAGCFFSPLWEREEDGGRRRGEGGGSTLHDNTYICLLFCSLSYQGLSLYQSTVVVTGG